MTAVHGSGQMICVPHSSAPLCITSEAYFIPADVKGNSMAERRERTRALIASWGRLLSAWPRLLEAARELKASGRRLSKSALIAVPAQRTLATPDQAVFAAATAKSPTPAGRGSTVHVNHIVLHTVEHSGGTDSMREMESAWRSAAVFLGLLGLAACRACRAKQRRCGFGGGLGRCELCGTGTAGKLRIPHERRLSE